MIGVCGYDPPMQFVHEDDLIELMTTLITRPVPGINNVANDRARIKLVLLAFALGKRTDVSVVRVVSLARVWGGE